MSVKHRPRPASAAARQRGQAALITVLLIIGIGAAAFVYALATPARTTIERDKITAAALAQAKEALIGYAAKATNRPGALPCPDTDSDGSANGPAVGTGQCEAYLGRLPWRTLGLPDLRDGSGEQLWYALSPIFRNWPASPFPGALNSDTSGELTITGNTAPIIAIVFAPGLVVGAQVRDGSTNQNNVQNYLECGNEDGDTTFVTSAVNCSLNDKLLPITSDALFAVVALRVAREVRTFLAAYFNANGYYPFATRYTDPTYNCTPGVTSGRIPNPSAPVLGLPNISVTCFGLADWLLGGPQPPAWFADNNWHLVTHYAVAPACSYPLSTLVTPCAGIGGLLTVQNMPAPNDDKRALVIVTGRALSGQSPRPCYGGALCSVTALLEDSPNTDGGDTDTNFFKPVFSPANNDRLVVVFP